MGLSLLAPLFLAGLVAVAVPVLVHLTARDRRDVRRFPSLRFLTRLPYRQARRQRLRHPLLFALRALAVAALALAFSRPLLEGLAAVAGSRGREVVIALDRSYSMGHEEVWERAVTAAREAARTVPEGSRVSLLTFAEEAEVAAAPAAGDGAVLAALDELAPGSGGTCYGPALRLAGEVLADSTLAERQVVLISDLQASGWERRSAGSGTAILAPGVALEVVDVAADEAANVVLAGAGARQSHAAGGAEMTVTARLVNRGPAPVAGLPVSVTVDPGAAAAPAGARRRAAVEVDLEPGAGAAVGLGPLDLPAAAARVTVRLGDDALPADNVFRLVVAPRVPVPVLLVEAPGARPESSLYLRRALAVPAGDPAVGEGSAAEAPAFDLRLRAASEVSPEDVEWASVVIVHDSPVPAGAAGRALGRLVAEGGGLWLVLGSRSPLPEGEAAALLPGRWRETVDRLADRGVALTGVDYDHPVFEVFAGPGGGHLAAARLFRYRPLLLAAGAAAVARTTDGAVVLAERRAGDGRVLLFGSALDNLWSDLPVQAVFLPLVHQVCRYLAGERGAPPWYPVGQALDLKTLIASPASAGTRAGTAIVETPAGERRQVLLDAGPALVALDEAGFYEVTLPGGGAPLALAANAGRTESDLTKLDAAAFVAASTALAVDDSAADAAGWGGLTRKQRERRQGVWWYLLLAAFLLLAAESVWSNRISPGGPAGRGGLRRA